MRKIYLVEDDQAIREVLEVFLGLEDFEVHSFISVTEFRERDTDVIPDLYLFDVNLPDGSGIDLCHQIKSDRKNQDVPVMIMSAHANLQHLKDLCEPDDMISKPFDIDNLLSRIQSTMDKSV
ncbi:response regulator [Chryseobacterium sp. KACC 21268]|nr:response regulator [Chryseobacterium sp. KACC 21268]